MADSTQYLVFERLDVAPGSAWLPIGSTAALSPKAAIEALVAERVAHGESRAEEYGACPVRNWSAGPVEVESKPTVRANVTSGYVGAPKTGTIAGLAHQRVGVGRVEDGGEYPGAPVSSAHAGTSAV